MHYNAEDCKNILPTLFDLHKKTGLQLAPHETKKMIPTLTPKMTISEEEVNSVKFPNICFRCNRSFLNATSLNKYSNHPTLWTNIPLIQRLRGATKAVQLAAKRKKDKIMVEGAPNVQINGTTNGTVASFNCLGHPPSYSRQRHVCSQFRIDATKFEILSKAYTKWFT